MLNKATLAAIAVAAIVYWGLEGAWNMMIMADHFKTAYAPFQSMMRPEGSVNPAMWLVSTVLASSLLMWVARRGTVTIQSAATVGAVLFGTITFMTEFAMNMYFKDYPFMPTSLISTAWEIAAGAMTGAVAGFVYTKLNKSA
ncbi:MAG: hypothetical protein H7X70_02895 [Candidatus Kapabacteria bacterium]|nr:hypothetical protein [Candidatus Kapabacteria bacterium]